MAGFVHPLQMCAYISPVFSVMSLARGHALDKMMKCCEGIFYLMPTLVVPETAVEPQLAPAGHVSAPEQPMDQSTAEEREGREEDTKQEQPSSAVAKSTEPAKPDR